jgi:general secretion pathway protein G
MARDRVSANGPLVPAIKLFQFDTGVWPGSLDDLLTRPWDEPVSAKWKGPYARNEDILDPWGNPFKYKANPNSRHNKSSFDFWSIGPDGVDGSEDDVKNWTK